MIPLTRMDGTKFVLNSDHILCLEGTPDTVITLITGARMMVQEPVAEVVELTLNFRRRQWEGVSVHGPMPVPRSEHEG